MTDVTSSTTLWDECLDNLSKHIPAQKIINWIRPLHAELSNNKLLLLAPNQFIIDWINQHYLKQIQETLSNLTNGQPPEIQFDIGTKNSRNNDEANSSKSFTMNTSNTDHDNTSSTTKSKVSFGNKNNVNGNVHVNFSFENFVEGKSNQLARAAALQIAENPGQAYNPLFLYGGVGLGKTHLMHAIGNFITKKTPGAKVLYLHSERFVADMIKALQRNAMNEFKRFYRSVNCLLIDDIQFFAGKERSQEEFFHTFNSLLDEQQQIVLTCDRYPKEIEGLEERLQSRFGWGLTIAVEPPELETRVAILISKAEQLKVALSQDVAFFIAKHIQSNVRELEGALKRIIANAQFTGEAITVPFAKEALKDLLSLQAKLVTIENIQRTTAEYYKVKVSDILSKRRNRSIARPRQVAMAIAKELTNHSLPEIGDAFGGRDHTTVLHACRKVKELLAISLDMQEDYKNLMRILSA